MNKTVVLTIPENTCVIIMPMPPVKTQPRPTHDTTGEEVHPSTLPPRKTAAA